MIKKIAWNTFKNTGDITTFLELRQITNIEDKIKNGTNINNELNFDINSRVQKVEQDGNSKDEWNNNFGK